MIKQLFLFGILSSSLSILGMLKIDQQSIARVHDAYLAGSLHLLPQQVSRAELRHIVKAVQKNILARADMTLEFSKGLGISYGLIEESIAKLRFLVQVGNIEARYLLKKLEQVKGEVLERQRALMALILREQQLQQFRRRSKL